MRPSADPLFRSVAEAFGPFSLGVILTGLGKDGSLGARNICTAAGKVIIQDPATAVAPFMPRSAIESCPKHSLVPLDQIERAISKELTKLSQKLCNG